MSSKNPLVSVIVPVRDAERLIERSLASAIAQTYHPLEIIVVDDGSTDKTAAIVEAFASRDKRLRLFRRQHSGVSAARNFGARQACGSLFAPLDADDLWHREKLSHQVAAMETSSRIGVVYTWAVEIDKDDFIIPPIRNGNTAEGNVFIELVSKAGMIDSGGNSLIRRSYFEAVGGYDTDLHHAEDWKLYLSLAKICEFAVVPIPLVGYRRSIESASRNVAAMARGMETVSSWIMEEWPDTPKEVVRQMIYHRNGYLAHLALTNNQYANALRYKFRGLKAWPVAFFADDTMMFGVRLLARIAGIRRPRWTVQARFTDDFVG